MHRLRDKISIWILTAAAACLLSSCGFSSVSPFVSGADVAFDPKLVGTWAGPDGEESAVIVREGDGYDIALTDKGRTQRFHGVLGRLGSRRVLDILPKELPVDDGDIYRSLFIPTHGIIVVEVTDSELTYRGFDSDAIKTLLNQRPSLVAHIKDRGLTNPGPREKGVVLTASTADVRKFLTEIIDRRGLLSDPETWRRK